MSRLQNLSREVIIGKSRNGNGEFKEKSWILFGKVCGNPGTSTHDNNTRNTEEGVRGPQYGQGFSYWSAILTGHPLVIW